jgi:hypothetical protein
MNALDAFIGISRTLRHLPVRRDLTRALSALDMGALASSCDAMVRFAERESCREPFDHEAVCKSCSVIFQREGMRKNNRAFFKGLVCEWCFEEIEEAALREWEVANG